MRGSTLWALVAGLGAMLTPAAMASTPASGSITVPFEYFKQHIYIAVSLNGKPGYSFMLDSGASCDVLNLRTARQMGLASGPVRPEKKVGFGDQRIYVAGERSANAAVGLLTVATRLSVMDLNPFENHFSHPTDGLLGVPFFRLYAVQIDFGRKLLTLSPAVAYIYHGDGIKLKLRPSPDSILMSVTIGNARLSRVAAMHVDTGTNATLLVYEPFARELGLEDSLQRAQPTRAFGLNGYYNVKRGLADSVDIGDAESRNCTVDFLEPSEDIELDHNIPGSIGTGILQCFKIVIFDLPRRQIIFEVKTPRWDPGLSRIETPDP